MVFVVAVQHLLLLGFFFIQVILCLFFFSVCTSFDVCVCVRVCVFPASAYLCVCVCVCVCVCSVRAHLQPTLDDKIQLGPRAGALNWMKGSSGGAGAKASESGKEVPSACLQRAG